MHYHDSPHSLPSGNQRFDDYHAWAHWEYSPEEWALFDRIDWRAIWLRYWLPNVIPPVCIFILGITAFRLSVLTMLLIMIAFVLPVWAAIFAIRAYAYGEAKKRHKARQNQDQPQRVTFSSDGVWEAGIHFPLGGPFLKLRSVHMTSQPTVLHFRLKYLMRNNYVRYTIHVLVPRGREEEAAQLMKHYQAKIAEAKKRTPSNPPEPV